MIIDKIEENLLNIKIYDTLKIKALAFEFCSTIARHSNNSLSLSDNEQTDMWFEIKATSSHSELFNYCHNIIADYDSILPFNNMTSEKITVNAMLKHIEDNYMHPISLLSLSKQLYCSRNYLSMLFKKHLGINFKSYLQDYRMKKAVELLLANQDNLSVIAEKVGYHDLKTFRKVFFTHYGMLPSEYRQNDN